MVVADTLSQHPNTDVEEPAPASARKQLAYAIQSMSYDEDRATESAESFAQKRLKYVSYDTACDTRTIGVWPGHDSPYHL